MKVVRSCSKLLEVVSWAPHCSYFSFSVQGLEGPFCFTQSWRITVLGTMFSFYFSLDLQWFDGPHFVCLIPAVRQPAGPILFSEIWMCQGIRWEESLFGVAQPDQVARNRRTKSSAKPFCKPVEQTRFAKKRFWKAKRSQNFSSPPALNKIVHFNTKWKKTGGAGKFCELFAFNSGFRFFSFCFQFGRFCFQFGRFCFRFGRF